MIQTNPKISVVMPVYNADDYLDPAIHSILNQTYKNFELIVVCSNPTQRTYAILEKYQNLDPRIVVHYQERNGIIAARNFGCQSARGEYVAVMDSDDISYPARFETEVSFLETHPEIGIIGSWVDIIDTSGKIIDTSRSPTGPYVIGWHLLFNNCMNHSTTLMRKNVLEDIKYYTRETRGFPEDYDLWTRAFFVTKIANIPVSLGQYRLHTENNSIGVNDELSQFCSRIRNAMIHEISGGYLSHFFEKNGQSGDINVFSFDRTSNKYQIELIENLYDVFSKRFGLTAQDRKEIRLHIVTILLVYSKMMLSYSKSESIGILLKACRYSPLGVLKTAVSFLRRKIERRPPQSLIFDQWIRQESR